MLLLVLLVLVEVRGAGQRLGRLVAGSGGREWLAGVWRLVSVGGVGRRVEVELGSGGVVGGELLQSR